MNALPGTVVKRPFTLSLGAASLFSVIARSPRRSNPAYGCGDCQNAGWLRGVDPKIRRAGGSGPPGSPAIFEFGLAGQPAADGRTTRPTLCNPKSKIKNQKSFTLIELLVVVAIIAVLVAMLLPALQSAREQAKQVTCSSNLRQVGLGLRMYMEDWKEMFPLTGWGGPGWWWGGYSMLERMTVYKYVTDEVRMCPSRQRSVYCENFSAIADYAHFQSRKITQDPYYFVVFGEHGVGNSGAWCFDWDTFPNRIRYVDDPLVDLYGGLSIDHRNGSNFLFLDNHVTWFKSGSDIGYQGTFTPNLYRYWDASGS